MIIVLVYLNQLVDKLYILLHIDKIYISWRQT